MSNKNLATGSSGTSPSLEPSEIVLPAVIGFNTILRSSSNPIESLPVDLDQVDEYHRQNPRRKGCFRPRYKNGKRLAQSIFGLSTRIVRLDGDKQNMWSTPYDKQRAMDEALGEEKEEKLDIFGNIVVFHKEVIDII